MREATYLGMTLKSTGFSQKMNVERDKAAIINAQPTARARLDTDRPRDSTNYGSLPYESLPIQLYGSRGPGELKKTDE